MNVKNNMLKKIIRLTILFFVMMGLSNFSKSFASTINQSYISINIENNGTCKVDEILYVTAAEEKIDYSTKYFIDSPYLQLTRGKEIEKLAINNYDIPSKDINNYYNDYAGVIKLAYSEPRTLQIFVIL